MIFYHDLHEMYYFIYTLKTLFFCKNLKSFIIKINLVFNFKNMATITIENVPESVVKTFGTNINYNNITSSFIPKKRQINRLKWLSKEEIEEKFYDKKDDTYWPFVWVEESISFLDRK